MSLEGPAPTVGAPGQMAAGLVPIDTNYGPLVVNFAVALHRAPRQKCEACGNRRVAYYVGLGDLFQSPHLCARCAGIR